jgi:hypothetical protein
VALGISSYSAADYVAKAAAFKKLFRPQWVIIPVRGADFEENAWNQNKGGGYAFFERTDTNALTSASKLLTVPDATSPGTDDLQAVSTPVSSSGWFSTVVRERLPSWYPLVTFAYLRKSDLEAWMRGHEQPWFHAATEPAPGNRAGENLGKYPLEAEMKLLATAYDGRLTLLYLSAFDPANPSAASETEKKLHELAGKEGVRFVSLRQEFPRLAEAGLAPYGFNNTRFNWGHWNSNGHAAAAKVLFDEFRQLQVSGKFPTPAANTVERTAFAKNNQIVRTASRAVPNLE